ncbi:MAG TPA: class I SAM-dependent methyltransferase [Candidatus Paceibacterota bacterium]
MNFYDRYILPKYLDQTMKGKDFEMHRAHVASGAHGTVLEIGFGSGLNLPHYKGVSKLYALDPSRELFDLAQASVRASAFPIEFVQASAEEVPLQDNSVDCIVSTWSLCSIPDLPAALGEMLRVLKPGGTFSFIEHGASPKRFTAILQHVLTPFSKKIAGGCHLDRNIERVITDAGFEITKLEKFATSSKPLAYMYKGAARRKNTTP